MTTRFLIVPVAAIAFLLIGVPYAAVAQSPRSALMPETIAACREQALSLEKLMALMALNGVSVNEVCECQSSLFISKLDDSWVRHLNREGDWSKAAADTLGPAFMQILNYCATTLGVARFQERTRHWGQFSIGRADPAQSPRRIDSPCRYATSARALSSGNVQLPIGCCTIKNG